MFIIKFIAHLLHLISNCSDQLRGTPPVVQKTTWNEFILSDFDDKKMIGTGSFAIKNNDITLHLSFVYRVIKREKVSYYRTQNLTECVKMRTFLRQGSSEFKEFKRL